MLFQQNSTSRGCDIKTNNVPKSWVWEKSKNNKLKTRRDPISFALCFQLWRSSDFWLKLSEKIKSYLKLATLKTGNHYSKLQLYKLDIRNILFTNPRFIFVEIFIYLLFLLEWNHPTSLSGHQNAFHAITKICNHWADDKQSKARNSDSKYRQMALVGFDT